MCGRSLTTFFIYTLNNICALIDRKLQKLTCIFFVYLDLSLPYNSNNNLLFGNKRFIIIVKLLCKNLHIHMYIVL